MDKFASSEQQLLEKIRQLPRDKVIEVEDFVDFLVQRNQRVRQRAAWHEEIAEMANDPEVQAEISAINAEFGVAELDGLQNL